MTHRFVFNYVEHGPSLVTLRNGTIAYVASNCKRSDDAVKYVNVHTDHLIGFTENSTKAVPRTLTWDSRGMSVGDSLHDIVGLFVPPVVFDHWGLIQVTYRYMAKDLNGKWHFFESKPVMTDNDWDILDRRPDNGVCPAGRALSASIFPNCDWKNSLIVRPTPFD